MHAPLPLASSITNAGQEDFMVGVALATINSIGTSLITYNMWMYGEYYRLCAIIRIDGSTTPIVKVDEDWVNRPWRMSINRDVILGGITIYTYIYIYICIVYAYKRIVYAYKYFFELMTYMTNTFSVIKQAERNLATFCDISNI